jgi:hypothetical protein
MRKIEGIIGLKCDSKTYLKSPLWSKVLYQTAKKATTQKDPILPILLIRVGSNLLLTGNGISQQPTTAVMPRF